MVNRLVIIVILLVAYSETLAKSIPSMIDSVTVYPSGAIVTRTANITLSTGVNDIRLEGLVDSIDVESLQIEVSSQDVQIGQIKLGQEQQRDTVDAEVASLQLKIEDTLADIQSIDDSSSAAKLRLTFLQGIAKGYANEAGLDASRGSADVASWRAALTLLQSGTVDANRFIRQNEKKKRERLKDLSVLKRTLANLSVANLATTELKLKLHATRAQSAELRVRYFQNNARWRPRYEARLNSDNGELQLLQQAEVQQETAEVWNNVKLILSTSAPNGDLIAPELESEFLSLYNPAPQKSRLFSGAEMAASDSVQEIVVTGSRVQARTGNFAVDYEMPGRTHISNDSDDLISVDLARFNFNVQLVTRIVPRESTEAYLTAKFVYDKAVPLYGSNMTVFVDGAFVGITEMPNVLPNADVVLPMGQDRRIEVAATTQGDADDRSGVFSKRKLETTDYVFEIVNRRNTPSFVEVLDLYPVARDKSIDVDVPRTATAPSKRDIDDNPGLIVWEKSLAAGETWRIRHQYTVSYPANRELTNN